MAIDPNAVTAIISAGIGILGGLSISYLWLRDARIYARTGLQGYRSAAYKGVLFTALGWFGAACCSGLVGNTTLTYLGFGLVLLALFLHSKVHRENVWTGKESAWERFTGKAPRQGR